MRDGGAVLGSVWVLRWLLVRVTIWEGGRWEGGARGTDRGRERRGGIQARYALPGEVDRALGRFRINCICCWLWFVFRVQFVLVVIR